MSFKGKNALITGSSRGIGRGIALKLAEKGARVAVHYYRNRDAAQATLKQIRELGSDGFLVQADVCHPDEVIHIFQQVRAPNSARSIFSSAMREPRRRLSTRLPWRSRWINGTPPLIRKPRHF